MSFGAGHIQDMNNRIKQNRASRPSKRAKFRENNREAIYAKEKAQEQLNLKSIPKERLSKIRKQIRKQAREDRKKELLIYGIALGSTLIALIILFIWMN